MNTYQILIFVLTSLISIGYLNFCTSNDEFKENVPRIWPNISDNSSFFQWPKPNLTEDGKLDISLFDVAVKIVNFTRGMPNRVARFGNFTLLQVAIMFAIGSMTCGGAVILAEALLYKHQHEHLHDHIKKRIDESRVPYLYAPSFHAQNAYLPSKQRVRPTYHRDGPKKYTNSKTSQNKVPLRKPSRYDKLSLPAQYYAATPQKSRNKAWTKHENSRREMR